MITYKGLIHKKSNQGFASEKYDKEKAQELRSKGGSARVPKGFSRMNEEKARLIREKAVNARLKKI